MTQSNEQGGDELRKELERLYRCVVYDRIDDVDRKELWIKEVGVVVEKLSAIDRKQHELDARIDTQPDSDTDVTTKDTQAEIDKILRRLVNRVERYAFEKWDSQPKDYPSGFRDVLFTQNMEDEATEAIIDWHNKQVDKILANDFFKYCQGCSCAAADLLEAERERLKESADERN